MLKNTGLGIATWTIGLSGGMLFYWLSIPLPWVLGSFLATAVIAQLGVELSLPSSWRGFAMLIIGTMLGAGFEQSALGHFVGWLPSIIVMLLLTAAFYWFAYKSLLRFSDMDPATAFLSAVPGGLSVVSALAEDLGGDLRRIALCHTCRLVVLILLTPVMIGLVSDYDLSSAGKVAFTEAKSFELLPMFLLSLCAALGWFLAKALKFNIGLLMFPLFFSAAIHITGLTDAHVPPFFSIFAQVVIGCGIGTRFRSYPLRDIVRDGRVSVLTGVVLALTSFAGAWATAQITGQETAALLLAFLPGGAPELGVVALSLNIDPAMVAVHSMLRVLAIILALAFYRRRLIWR